MQECHFDKVAGLKACNFIKKRLKYSCFSMKTGAQPEIFQGRGYFVKLGHFEKHFLKNVKKKGPAGKKFGFFLPRYSQNYILNGKFNLRMDTIRAFFSKIRALFYFQKTAGEAPPSP